MLKFEHKILFETTAFNFHKYGHRFTDCLCYKNISWQGMMHACSAFEFILQILSATFFHVLLPAIWLTIACNLPPPLPISIDLRQQTQYISCIYVYLGLVWYTCEISNVLLACDQAFYIRNRLFYIMVLACN